MWRTSNPKSPIPLQVKSSHTVCLIILVHNTSVHPKNVPWNVRVDLPLTILWRSRRQTQNQERASCSRVRKPQSMVFETKQFNSKRPAPSDSYSTETSHGHPGLSGADYQNVPSQGQNDRAGGFGATGYRESYDEPAMKRQRLSMELPRRSTYDHEQQVAQRLFMQPRDPLGSLGPRELQVANRGSQYSQGPSSASGSTAADYGFGHQRTNSSSTSSPFVSPRHEYSAYSFSSPNHSLYQQPTRDQSYQYPQNQYSEAQPRQALQFAQPAPTYRGIPSALSSQPDPLRSFPRSYEAESHMPTDRGYGSVNPISRVDYYPSQPTSTLYERPLQPLARTLPDPSVPMNSVLPPIQSTVPSSQTRRETPQQHPGSGVSNIEGHPQLNMPSPPNQEGQGYPPHMYHGSHTG